MKRTFLKMAGLSLVALSMLGVGAAKADFPDKALTLVVSFPAGGNADVMARIQAEALGKELGVPVNVVNRPGGAHVPATMSVLEAPADGYTLFNWSPPSFMVVPLTRATPYQPLDDFTPLFAGISASTLYMCAGQPLQHVCRINEGAKGHKDGC